MQLRGSTSGGHNRPHGPPPPSCARREGLNPRERAGQAASPDVLQVPPAVRQLLDQRLCLGGRAAGGLRVVGPGRRGLGSGGLGHRDQSVGAGQAAASSSSCRVHTGASPRGRQQPARVGQQAGPTTSLRAAHAAATHKTAPLLAGQVCCHGNGTAVPPPWQQWYAACGAHPWPCSWRRRTHTGSRRLQEQMRG